MPKKILISTLPPELGGGVMGMLNFALEVLSKEGYKITLAFYYPYSKQPSLSVPILRAGRVQVGQIQSQYLGYTSIGLGAYLPELEFLNYYPHHLWKKLIDEHDEYLVVSGHALAALPFYLCRKNYFLWLATPFNEDRKDRVKSFPWYRKCIDRLVNVPVASFLEKRLLRTAKVAVLSQYTEKQFKKILGKNYPVLSVPIDTDVFSPDFSKLKPWTISFVGRFTDPRKNISLLFRSLAILIKKYPSKLQLIGSGDIELINKLIAEHQLQDHISLSLNVNKQNLANLLQSTDVFVIPSYQEGLCIAGLEAMACGCPIVSTACGGPEEFVKEDIGFIVPFDAEVMANRIEMICTNPALRIQLGKRAAEYIVRNHNYDMMRANFIRLLANS